MKARTFGKQESRIRDRVGARNFDGQGAKPVLHRQFECSSTHLRVRELLRARCDEHRHPAVSRDLALEVHLGECGVQLGGAQDDALGR